jgi:hypothetical protein
MAYTANIEGFEGQNIEVRNSFWTGPKLMIDNEPAPKGSKRGEMILVRNDGRQVTALWKPQGLGLDVPQLVVEGKTVNFVEPLKWYQWVWSGLPIALVFIGGLLGAIAGFAGFSINARIFRTKMNGILKYVVTGVISLAVTVVYLFAATLIRMLIGG